MVATSQTIASQIGVDILKSGGSAVDAAIAANAMLSLAEPYMCGPGGDLFALVWDPKTNALAGLNASGRSAAGISYAGLRGAVGESAIIPGRGPLSVSVPGAVDGWCALHDRYGRLPLAEVFAPAIAHARDTFGAELDRSRESIVVLEMIGHTIHHLIEEGDANACFGAAGIRRSRGTCSPSSDGTVGRRTAAPRACQGIDE